jgi:hypothetical protein
MTRPLPLHLLFMALGYALAVAVATLTVCLLMGAPSIFPDQGQWGSFYRYLQDLPGMLYLGSIMTATYGFPGWLISVVAAEFRFERRKFWFAIAGVLTAFLALILSGFGGRMFSDLIMKVSILVGGACGGFAYWLIAGKSSGSWRRASPIEVLA